MLACRLASVLEVWGLSTNYTNKSSSYLSLFTTMLIEMIVFTSALVGAYLYILFYIANLWGSLFTLMPLARKCYISLLVCLF